eukprot:COSAG06_NODE_770_length_12437_cov_27.452423_12_plen_74_part_00
MMALLVDYCKWRQKMHLVSLPVGRQLPRTQTEGQTPVRLGGCPALHCKNKKESSLLGVFAVFVQSLPWQNDEF